MTRNIYLKGRMGQLFGEVHRLNVKTVQEAMNAIDTMKGGLRTYLSDCTENGVEFFGVFGNNDGEKDGLKEAFQWIGGNLLEDVGKIESRGYKTFQPQIPCDYI